MDAVNKIKGTSEETINIEEMKRQRDYLNREIEKYYASEKMEKLKLLDEEYLGRVYKKKEEYKGRPDFYKVIAVSNWGLGLKTLRIAWPEKKWIKAVVEPRPYSDEDVLFEEEWFATLEDILITDLHDEYQEVSMKEWDQVFLEFIKELKVFSNIKINSEELYR